MSFLRSFLSGASTVFGLAPTMPEPNVGTLADDWCAMGEDIRAAIRKDFAARMAAAENSLHRELSARADEREFAFIQRQIA